jgi:DNA-binding NarL/FixJ family response regulator
VIAAGQTLVLTATEAGGLDLVCILVVDDFAAFRRTVHRILEQRQDIQLVGEASDGLDAVQKAEELLPDLIVLDIGLPKLNGMEAAIKIRELAPKAKMVFLSTESSADVVQKALRLGDGYVLKADAGKELLAAAEAVLQGRQYISTGLAGRI